MLVPPELGPHPAARPGADLVIAHRALVQVLQVVIVAVEISLRYRWRDGQCSGGRGKQCRARPNLRLCNQAKRMLQRPDQMVQMPLPPVCRCSNTRQARQAGGGQRRRQVAAARVLPYLHSVPHQQRLQVLHHLRELVPLAVVGPAGGVGGWMSV